MTMTMTSKLRMMMAVIGLGITGLLLSTHSAHAELTKSQTQDTVSRWDGGRSK